MTGEGQEWRCPGKPPIVGFTGAARAAWLPGQRLRIALDASGGFVGFHFLVLDNERCRCGPRLGRSGEVLRVRLSGSPWDGNTATGPRGPWVRNRWKGRKPLLFRCPDSSSVCASFANLSSEPYRPVRSTSWLAMCSGPRPPETALHHVREDRALAKGSPCVPGFGLHSSKGIAVERTRSFHLRQQSAQARH